MVTGIFIYVEGGGGKVADQRLRAGFEALLSELKEAARLRRMHFRVIPCGDGPRTCRDFGRGVRSEADALNVLLIDSDGPVKDGRRTHMLALWNVPLPDLPDDHFHLMVEAMESWLVADPDTLARYYGSGFHARRLPRDPKVEEMAKKDVLDGLKEAAAGTKKAKYHKTRDGFALLAEVDSAKVRQAAPHCDRLFTTLQAVIEST